MENGFGVSDLPPFSELEALLLQWVLSCTKDFKGVMQAVWQKRPLPPHPIPENLLPTITANEPYRTQAMQQAGQWLNTPWSILFGPEILLPKQLAIAPFAKWEHAISPVEFKVWWTQDMAGRVNEYASGTIERVAVEGKEWRIVSFNA